MAVLRYITHAEVVVDPTVPVVRWGLSDVGRNRVATMLGQPWIGAIRRIICSGEPKAIQTAAMLATRTDLEIEIRPDTGENDRSATGFLPPEDFEQVADTFFAQPDRSVRGWERAIDAQRRIVAATADLLGPNASGDIAVIGHGGVGTLLYCALAQLPIDRHHDQPGQGHYFSVDLAASNPLHGWRPIDETDA